ncbi:hypothetical protein LF599_07355 [Pseudodesulfovibrio thermohalotolerans]|uniref:hypothetical protein n=1 Tax=Pseudodesulfovibrio thermohalotolerans TaxID=2880651 RepID=UPI0022BA0F8D|nr:hypothetical protein [Pseudodesulfovibrio thermohalotolerans]WFS63971.1 hypothetical protein LF599_07355 [Pseudodesulfovibrio thermohalotolerans]
MGKDRTTKNGNGEIAKNINYFERLHPLFKSWVVKRIEYTKDKIFVEQLGGNLLAGAEVVFGAENVILAGCVDINSGIIDVEMDITPEMFVDLLPAFDEFAPCDSKKSRRAPVIYKNGKLGHDDGSCGCVISKHRRHNAPRIRQHSRCGKVVSHGR